MVYMIYVPNDTSVSHYRPGEEGHSVPVAMIEYATTAAEVCIQVRTTGHSVLTVLTVFCIYNVLVAMTPRIAPPNISLTFSVQHGNSRGPGRSSPLWCFNQMDDAMRTLGCKPLRVPQIQR